MNVQDLISPDNEFIREMLAPADWEEAQRQLDDGHPSNIVRRRLIAWSKDCRYEQVCAAREYHHCIEQDHA